MPVYPFDYTLYLVTGRELLPPGKDYFDSLEESIQGGVTMVQVREKKAETGEFLSIAKRTLDVCHKYGIPVIINDRIDIALAIHADGVHLGQNDMPISVARRLLPPGTIIGTSVNTPNEARKAMKDGVDYVGIGALWDTQSKQLTNPILGVRGVGQILQTLAGSDIKTVAIGGIKSTNVLRALHGAVAPFDGRRLDGVAVISDIVASRLPFEASKRLAVLVKAFKALDSPPVFSFVPKSTMPLNSQSIVREAAHLLTVIKRVTPLVHQITNTVVTTQSANATLALGASPIMSNTPEEMQDLSRAISSLLINIGTVGNKQAMLLAVQVGGQILTENLEVVFDPVAVGATEHRKMVTDELLNEWQASVIKGNASEIAALASSTEAQARGVDSVGPGLSDAGSVVRALAQKERCIIVLTGEVDWLSDGKYVLRSTNGHSLLGSITGSGCMVGTCIAAFCGAASMQAEAGTIASLISGNMFIAALGGLLSLTIASEIAGTRPDVKGTGSFLPVLMDELYNLTPEQIIERARVEIVQ